MSHLIAVLVVGPMPTAEPPVPLSDELLQTVIDPGNTDPLAELQLLAFDDEEVAARLEMLGLAHDAATVDQVRQAAARSLPGEDMGDVQQCEWLYGTDTLAGAIHLDLHGEPMRCNDVATTQGIVPAPADARAGAPDFLVQLCQQHYTEAKAEGLQDVVQLTV